MAVLEQDLLVYGAYTQIVESLQHYNRVQAIYRTFISTWLLATFVGIGYVLSSYETNLPFHPLVTVAFICLASAMGVFLVWFMDLIVCEQQIAASVFEGIELEKTHKWLPKFYHNIQGMCGLVSYINMKSIFYIGCQTILIITGGSSVTVYISIEHKYFSMTIPIISVILILLTAYVLISATKKTDPYYRLKKLSGE